MPAWQAGQHSPGNHVGTTPGEAPRGGAGGGIKVSSAPETKHVISDLGPRIPPLKTTKNTQGGCVASSDLLVIMYRALLRSKSHRFPYQPLPHRSPGCLGRRQVPGLGEDGWFPGVPQGTHPPAQEGPVYLTKEGPTRSNRVGRQNREHISGGF